MDLATLIGLVGVCIVVGTAIVLGGWVAAFVNAPSLVLVLGGTLLVTLMKFSVQQFLNATKVAIEAFIYRVPEAEDLIDESIELLEKDSLASGNAQLEPGAHDALAKVGRLVASMQGAITVSGHTDNVPIKGGGTDRSNWDLSAPRAVSVAHVSPPSSSW